MYPTYLAIIMLSVISALTMFFQVRYNSVLSAKSKRYFALMFFCIIVVAVSEALGDWMDLGGSWRAAHRIVKCVEFSAMPWLAVLMALGCGAEENPGRVILPLCAHMLFEWLALPFGLIIRIDSGGLYDRGPFYFVYIIVDVATLIYLLREKDGSHQG